VVVLLAGTSGTGSRHYQTQSLATVVPMMCYPVSLPCCWCSAASRSSAQVWLCCLLTTALWLKVITKSSPSNDNAIDVSPPYCSIQEQCSSMASASNIALVRVLYSIPNNNSANGVSSSLVVGALQHPGAALQCGSAACWHQWHWQEHPGWPAGCPPGHHNSAEHRQHPPHAAQLCSRRPEPTAVGLHLPGEDPHWVWVAAQVLCHDVAVLSGETCYWV